MEASMKFVVAGDGKIVSYSNTINGVEYFCFLCHDALIRKTSQKNNVYFSHKPNKACQSRTIDPMRSCLTKHIHFDGVNYTLITLYPSTTMLELKPYLLPKENRKSIFSTNDINDFLNLQDKLLRRYLWSMQEGRWLVTRDNIFEVIYIPYADKNNWEYSKVFDRLGIAIRWNPELIH